MSNKIQNECKHLILNKLYCLKCGTLYYKGVRNISYLYLE